MTLRESLLSVDSEEYTNISLYHNLIKMKSNYGSHTFITARLKGGELTVSCHFYLIMFIYFFLCVLNQ